MLSPSGVQVSTREGKVSSQRAHLLPHSSSSSRRVGQALAPKAIAKRLRSGGVWEAESNIDLLDLLSIPAAADWNASIPVERINFQ
jgi:hypothetical protein